MPWKPKKSIMAMGALRIQAILEDWGKPEVLATVVRDVVRNAAEDGTKMKHAASPVHLEKTMPMWVDILEEKTGITAYDIKLAKKLDQRPHVRCWLLRFGHKNWPSYRIQLYEVLAQLLAAETPLATYDQQVDPQLMPTMSDFYTAMETEVRRQPKMIRRSNSKGYNRDDPSQQYDGADHELMQEDGKDPLSFPHESSKPWLIPSRIVTWPDRRHVISFDELNKRWKTELKILHKEAKKKMMTEWRVERLKAIKAKVKKHKLPAKPHLGYPRGKWSPFYVKSDLESWMLNQKPMLAKVLKTMEPEEARQKAIDELKEIIEAMNGAAHGDRRAEFKLKSKRRRWFGKIGAELNEMELLRHLKVGSVPVEVEPGVTASLPVWYPRPWHALERFKKQLRRKMVNDIRTPKGQAWFPKQALPVEMQHELDSIVMEELTLKGREPDMLEIECEERFRNDAGQYESMIYHVVEPRWAIEAYYDIRMDPDLEAECEELNLDPRCPNCHGIEEPRPRSGRLTPSPQSPGIEILDSGSKSTTPTCGHDHVLLGSEDELGPVRPACGRPLVPGYAFCYDHMTHEDASLWPWS
jgi:hypothetical protein